MTGTIYISARNPVSCGRRRPFIFVCSLRSETDPEPQVSGSNPVGEVSSFDSLRHSVAAQVEYLAWCGEIDRAFEWLGRGVQQQDPLVRQVETSHAYDSLRDDPRYDDLLHRMRFSNVNPTPAATAP